MDKNITRHEWMIRARQRLAEMGVLVVVLLTEWDELSNEDKQTRLEEIGEKFSTVITMVRDRFIFK